MSNTIITFLLILSTISTLTAQSLKDSLTLELNELIENSEIPGLSVSIVGKRGLLYSGGFGYREVASKKPYDGETVQSVASISKTIIAVALMKLTEDNKISLEEDINTFLPFKVVNPNFPDSKITLLHLATHTSSIIETDEADDGSYFIIDKNVLKDSFPKGYYKYYKKHLKNVDHGIGPYLQAYLSVNGKNFKKNIFGEYRPGEEYSYSNVGASLAAYIVELVSGQSFEEFTKAHIFTPLNMDNTTWKHPNSTNVATLYFHTGVKVPAYSLITFPSGDLHTTADDIGKFMADILNGYQGAGKLLSAASYTYMLTNRITNNGSNSIRGILWEINAEGNIGHGGAEIGTTCRMIYSPKLNKAFFMMINISVYDDDQLSKDYVDILIALSKYAKRME